MAISKGWGFFAGLLLILMFSGCGGIRFLQVAPEATDFHPNRIAILALDMGGHQEAQEILDQVVTSELRDTNWFQKVLSAEAVRRLFQENEVLRNTASEYLGKLTAVSFSDGDLSGKIGKLAQVDALLLVNVDYWYYTKKLDKNIAKVGLGMKLINAENGLLVWKAGHDLAPEYVFLKPELSDVARSVVRQMVKSMPH